MIARWPLEVRLAVVLTLVVALGAGTLSWSALTAFASGAHIDARITWVYPVVVDGQMAVGTVAAFVLRRAPLRTRAYIWSMIGASIAVSVAGNAAHATGAALPPEAAALASAVPAAALAASLHLMVVITKSTTHTGEARASVRSGRAVPVARGRRAGARRREAPVELADGRTVSAGHARKLRALARAAEAA